MYLVAAALFLLALVISTTMTAVARATARRFRLMDAPGERKVHTVATPRNGGIGIFWGIGLPLLLGILGLTLLAPHAASLGGRRLSVYVPGLLHQRPLALLLIGATFAIHLLGLLDDRLTLRPWPKLLGQIAIAGLLVGIGEALEPGGFRALTFLGDFPSPGFWLSIAASLLWIVALTNAFNFLDNMDGLSAGVAFLCGLMFLIAAFHNGQWFICALLLLFMGSLLGFLFFNFPPASIFMGDGGSMVLGFFLSALTIRTTYYPGTGHPYAVLMPLIVLAVPLYDLIIVSIVRIARGQSPMTGDTNHFSHRLVRHGFSKRGAVLLIYGVTLASGLSAPLLARVDDQSALLIGIQVLAMLVVIGIFERVGEHTA